MISSWLIGVMVTVLILYSFFSIAFGVSSKVYCWEMSWQEAKFLWFGKKICPYCGNKLKKMKKETLIEEGIIKLSQGSYTIGEKYRVKTYFRCKGCKKNIQIRDLEK